MDEDPNLKKKPKYDPVTDALMELGRKAEDEGPKGIVARLNVVIGKLDKLAIGSAKFNKKSLYIGIIIIVIALVTLGFVIAEYYKL